jgi:hypothetical protein
MYLIPILLFFYIFRKQIIKKQVIALDIDHKIEPPHSHDFAYKRAYLTPVDKTNHTCRANSCVNSCKDYHYKFPSCVYSQPEYVPLSSEDGKESEHSKVVKGLKYY